MINKVISYILLTCFLMLAIHVGMMVAAEKTSGTRSFTPEKIAELREAMARAASDTYANGGDAVNSALVLYLGSAMGPSTTEVFRSKVFFDFEGRGRAVQTGWIGPDSGFLIMPDAFSDYDAVNGLNLFGNHTPGNENPGEEQSMETGRALVKNPEVSLGFAALARYDNDSNGVIDKNDPVWSKLKVWRDVNQNGQIDKGEIFALDELDIVALNLEADKEGSFLPDNNYLFASGSYRLSDGGRGRLDEIYFQRVSASRKFLRKVFVSPAIEEIVPDIKGGGVVRDLREAAAQDPALLEAIKLFNSAKSREDEIDLIDSMMVIWAATGDLESDLEARAAGRYQFIDNCLNSIKPEQRKLLPVLDAWAGRYHYWLPDELAPGQDADSKIIQSGPEGNELTVLCPEKLWSNDFPQAFVQIKSDIYFGMLAGSRLKTFLDLVDMSQDKKDGSKLMERFELDFDDDPRKAEIDLLELRIILALKGIPSNQLPGLDDYITGKNWAVDLDEALPVLHKYMLKRIAMTDNTDREKRKTVQWGTDKTGK